MTMAETRAEKHLKGGDATRRPSRRLPLAALAVVLVALIGLGSRAPLWDIGGPPRLADPSSYAGDLVTLALALLVVLPFVIRAIRRRHRPASKPDPDLPPVRTSLWSASSPILSLPVAIGIALFVISRLPGQRQAAAGGRLPPPEAARHGAERSPPTPRALADALVGVRAARARADRRRRGRLVLPRPPDPPKEKDEPDELLVAVDLSLEDIENEPDPRRAVIRAYGRMERALGSYGLARRPAETPLEYLARALTSLRVGRRSVERLSALFERAKFSQHEIDLSMKSEALSALGALRDELAGAPA